MSKLDSRGWEIPDPTPVEVPVGFRVPPTLEERIRAAVRTTLSQVAADHGAETFEEADDFEVGDDYEPRSQWELDLDGQPPPEASRTAQEPPKPGGEGSGSTPPPPAAPAAS